MEENLWKQIIDFIKYLEEIIPSKLEILLFTIVEIIKKYGIQGIFAMIIYCICYHFIK